MPVFSSLRPVLTMLLCGLLFVNAALRAEPQVPIGQDEPQLPYLGDVSSSIISTDEEHFLGQIWLMQLRSQVTMLDDPVVNHYLENLLGQLAGSSQLQDRRLTLVVIDSPELNAFAVPGGVVGVNAGLFSHARNEAQLASVLAHELAHLSQRHHVRMVDSARKNSVPMLAAMLAGVVLAASGGGDAGMAMITGSQAALIQEQLRFSRQYESEADRIGMLNLVAAGYDPRQMPAMFEQMLQARSFAGDRAPQFLLTHPLTEARIADTQNRVAQYPDNAEAKVDSIEYEQARSRMQNALEGNPVRIIKQVEATLATQPGGALDDGNRYLLALAQLKAQRPQEAEATLKPLLEREPLALSYLYTQVQIDMARGRAQAALARLDPALKRAPDSYPLTIAQAEALLASGRPAAAEPLLARLSRERPWDAPVWYRLAEARGRSGDARGMHRAQGEYALLMGQIDDAQRQLEYARALSQGNYGESASVDERLGQIRRLRKQLGMATR
jgi:predicted Zn-dependent protease